MKKIVYAAILFCITQNMATAQVQTGKEVLAKMHKKYYKKWHKNFTFTQTTKNYKNDSLIKTTPWHEYIVYPNLFRITFGEPKDGNAVIYKDDSTYVFRKGKLAQTVLRTEDMPFLIGGMYFMPLEKVYEKTTKEGFDVNKAYTGIHNGKPVYVIGAASAEEKVGQLFIDMETLLVVKFIKYLPNMKQEVTMDKHIKVSKRGYTETEVGILINDKLYQTETYYNTKANTTINPQLFDTKNFVVE
jgi:outer membrane lipoprotein-sorting protein